MTRSRRTRRAAAMLEFALMLPVLILLFVGIVDLAMYMSTAHFVSRAVRDGARIGSITLAGDPNDGTALMDAAVAQAEAVLTAVGHPCAAACTITPTWEAGADGSFYLTLEVEYPYDPILEVAIGGFAYHSPTAVRSSFTMLTQKQPLP